MLIWFEGWEGSAGGRIELAQIYDAASVDANWTGVVAATGRDGSRGMVMSAGAGNNQCWVEKISPSGFTEYVQQIAINFSSTAGNSTQLFGVREGVTRHAEVYVTAAGVVQVMRAGTVVASSAASVVAIGSGYHLVEAKIKIHDTTGYAIVKVDGIEVINATGLDTRNGGTGVCDRHYIGNRNALSITNTVAHVDDYVMIVVDGTAPNDFIGDAHEERLTPNGAGNSTQFTPSAGANYAAVDEVVGDDDTTYVSSSTVGHKDTYTASDLLDGEVFGIKHYLRARKAEVGSRVIRPLIRIGGTDYEGSDVGLGDSYNTRAEFRSVSPATAVPFTYTELNGAEIGVKIES